MIKRLLSRLFQKPEPTSDVIRVEIIRQHADGTKWAYVLTGEDARLWGAAVVHRKDLRDRMACVEWLVYQTGLNLKSNGR